MATEMEDTEITLPALSADVAEKFAVVGTHCTRVLNTAIGDITFARLTLEQAETLVSGGFRYLERKVIDEPKPKAKVITPTEVATPPAAEAQQTDTTGNAEPATPPLPAQ